MSHTRKDGTKKMENNTSQSICKKKNIGKLFVKIHFSSWEKYKPILWDKFFWGH